MVMRELYVLLNGEPLRCSQYCTIDAYTKLQASKIYEPAEPQARKGYVQSDLLEPLASPSPTRSYVDSIQATHGWSLDHRSLCIVALSTRTTHIITSFATQPYIECSRELCFTRSFGISMQNHQPRTTRQDETSSDRYASIVADKT